MRKIFFPMAEEALSAEEGEMLLAEFTRYEQKCDAGFDDYRNEVEMLG